MSAYVVDASLFERAATPLATAESMYAPELIDLEVANLLRKSILRGARTSIEATELFEIWTGNSVQRVSHGGYLDTVWALRHNITPHDASYVALAMHLGLPLVTADNRLAKAASAYCEVVPTD